MARRSKRSQAAELGEGDTRDSRALASKAHHTATTRARAQIIATQTTRTRTHQNILQQSNSTHMKRPLATLDSNYGPQKPKRSRITVEIVSRHFSDGTTPPKPLPVTKPRPAATTRRRGHSPPLAPEIAPPASTASPRVPAARPAQLKAATAPKKNKEPNLTKHKEKVINGIKHELDRLQPSVADASQAPTQGRKLRSQEAIRFKSELAAYFPDYDEVIGNDPKEQRM
jgi:hypothetical protein